MNSLAQKVDPGVGAQGAHSVNSVSIQNSTTTTGPVNPKPAAIGATAFNPKISIVRSANDTQTETISLRTVLSEIKGGRWKKQVQQVRDAYGAIGKESANELKKKLPAVTPSGLFSGRGAAALQQQSGIMGPDIDLKDNPKLAVDFDFIRAAIELDQHALAVFRSPSGTGLKVLVRCDPSRPHWESFNAAKRYFSKRFGLKIDDACSDVSRLCFVSYDPDLFTRDDVPLIPYSDEDKVDARVFSRSTGALAEADRVVPIPDDFGEFTKREVRQILAAIPARPDYPDWLKILSAVFATLNFDEGFEVLNEWSPEEKPGEYADKYRHRLTDVGIGTLVYYAKQHGFDTSVLRRPVASAIRGFPVWSPSQFASFTPDPSAVLLGDGFLQRGETTSFVGAGGLGKTRLLTYLAVQHITQRPWCGLDTKGGPVKWLIFSTESGLRRWHGDLGTMLALNSPAEIKLIDQHFRALAITPDEEADLNLGIEENIDRLAQTLAVEKPGVVVFDPFADMVDGDENLAVDVGRTLRTLKSLLRKNAPDAACIIIHHSRTGAANVVQAGDNYNAGNFGRGSKALYSRVRCELQLAPADRDDPNKLVLACGKANDCKKFDPRGIIFDPMSFTYSVDPNFDINVWRADVAGKRAGPVVTMVDLIDVVTDLIAVGPGTEFSTTAIAAPLEAQTGCSKKTVLRRLNDAVKAGYLKVGSKRGLWALGTKKPTP